MRKKIQLPLISHRAEFIHRLTQSRRIWFFFLDENHHFEYLAEQAFSLLLMFNAASRQIRNLARSLFNQEKSLHSIECISCTLDGIVQVIVTDLDLLRGAKPLNGVYTIDRLKGLSTAERWFLKGSGSKNGYVKVKPELPRNY